MMFVFKNTLMNYKFYYKIKISIEKKLFSILTNELFVKPVNTYNNITILNKNLLNSNPTTFFNTQFNRLKYKEKGEITSTANDDADENDDDLTDVNFIKVYVNSLRADLLLKAGLGLARNKVEAVFYESKIRVNGKKIFKKSLKLNVGDEVDIIKGVSPFNSDHLIVARVEILSAIPKEDNILVKLRRVKTMTVENYNTTNSWTPKVELDPK